MPRKTGKVLILSPHIMTAALVGWYVELSRLEPAFAAPGENPSEAMARVKPLLVILIDATSEDAISDLFVARAAKREVGVAMFSGSTDDEAAREWARRHEMPFFRLPVDFEAFGRALDQAARLLPERRHGDRRRAVVDRAIDGTLCLTDHTGRAWYVYDRRGGERRGNDAYRAFISPEGEEMRALLSEDEFHSREPEALIAQLERAAPAD